MVKYSPYNETPALKTATMIRGDKPYQTNTYYMHKAGFVWYENNKGYLHVSRIERCQTMNGKTIGYEISCYRLTKKDTCVYEGRLAVFDTTDKAVDAIKSLDGQTVGSVSFHDSWKI